MHRDISVSNSEPIVAWIDTFIREIYELRRLLVSGTAIDGETIKQIFEQAFEARALWLTKLGKPSPRQDRSGSDIPSFTENIGELFVGRRLMEAQKKILGKSQDGGRKER
jgi:hypothetical protein